MRKVLWVAGARPEGMTPEKYKETASLLAFSIDAELVKFGESSYMIIGDDEAEKKYNDVVKRAEERKSFKGDPDQAHEDAIHKLGD